MLNACNHLRKLARVAGRHADDLHSLIPILWVARAAAAVDTAVGALADEGAHHPLALPAREPAVRSGRQQEGASARSVRWGSALRAAGTEEAARWRWRWLSYVQPLRATVAGAGANSAAIWISIAKRSPGARPSGITASYLSRGRGWHTARDAKAAGHGGVVASSQLAVGCLDGDGLAGLHALRDLDLEAYHLHGARLIAALGVLVTGKRRRKRSKRDMQI